MCCKCCLVKRFAFFLLDRNKYISERFCEIHMLVVLQLANRGECSQMLNPWEWLQQGFHHQVPSSIPLLNVMWAVGFPIRRYIRWQKVIHVIHNFFFLKYFGNRTKNTDRPVIIFSSLCSFLENWSTDAILAFEGNTFSFMLWFIKSVRGLAKISADSLIIFVGIRSRPTAFFRINRF